jgi:hypothetical protein
MQQVLLHLEPLKLQQGILSAVGYGTSEVIPWGKSASGKPRKINLNKRWGFFTCCSKSIMKMETAW